MSLQQKLIIAGTNTGLIKIVFAIAVSIIGFCLSINIDASFIASSSLFWFILLSQLVYVAVFLRCVAKLVQIFLKQKDNNKQFLKAKSAIDRFPEKYNATICSKDSLNNNNTTKKSIVDNNFLMSSIKEDTENFVENHNNNKPPIYLSNEFYEIIPLPLIITNKEGVVKNYNQQAQSFFNTDLSGKNISEFIEILSVQVLHEVSVVTVKVQILNKESFVSSLFQTTVYDNNNEIISVILFFLPLSIERNNNTERVLSYNVHYIFVHNNTNPGK